MRRADARSAQIAGPDFISQCFQVSSYSREPNAAILACNLLSKDNWRLALFNEISSVRPEMAFIVNSFSFTGDRKWLTGKGSGPDR
jgi:hypothetical protein